MAMFLLLSAECMLTVVVEQGLGVKLQALISRMQGDCVMWSRIFDVGFRLLSADGTRCDCGCGVCAFKLIVISRMHGECGCGVGFRI